MKLGSLALAVAFVISCRSGADADKSSSANNAVGGESKVSVTTKDSTPEATADQASVVSKSEKPVSTVVPSVVVARKGSIAVVGPSGTTTVATVAVKEATLSQDFDLVWVFSDGTLSVLDLRKPSSKLIPIVSGVPDVPFDIGGKLNTTVLKGGAPETMTLEWNAKPKLSVNLSFGEITDQETYDAIKSAKLVGKPWLTSEFARKPRKDQRTAASSSQIAGVTKCDEEDCGEAYDFGNWGWKYLISSVSCGDYCYAS